MDIIDQHLQALYAHVYKKLLHTVGDFSEKATADTMEISTWLDYQLKAKAQSWNNCSQDVWSIPDISISFDTLIIRLENQTVNMSEQYITSWTNDFDASFVKVGRITWLAILIKSKL